MYSLYYACLYYAYLRYTGLQSMYNLLKKSMQVDNASCNTDPSIIYSAELSLANRHQVALTLYKY